MMKKFLLSVAALSSTLTVSAFAADLPSRKEPILLPAPLTWTGVYVGLNAGGAIDASNNVYVVQHPVFLNDTRLGLDGAMLGSFTSASAGTGSVGNNNGGFIGGGQVGYNYQFDGGVGSGWLVGLEADIQGVAGSSGNSNSILGAPLGPPAPPGFGMLGVTQVSKSLDYLGTARGRIGFLFAPTLLLYGTGGLAYGGVHSSTSQFQTFVPANPAPPGILAGAWGAGGSFSNTLVGWTAGGGLEWMFMPNWSAKVEYLYYDIGSINYSSGASGSIFLPTGAPLWLNGVGTSARFNGHIARAGVNYHFNWGAPAPVLARY